MRQSGPEKVLPGLRLCAVSGVPKGTCSIPKIANRHAELAFLGDAALVQSRDVDKGGSMKTSPKQRPKRQQGSSVGLGLTVVGLLKRESDGLSRPACLGLSTPMENEQALGKEGKRVAEERIEPNHPKPKMLMLYDEEGLSRMLATPAVLEANSSLPLEVKQVMLPTGDENPTIQQIKSLSKRKSGKSSKRKKTSELATSGGTVLLLWKSLLHLFLPILLFWLRR